MPHPADPPVTLSGARVRLRPWTDADLAPFAAMNDDPEVMHQMSAHLTREQSDAFALRIRMHIAEHGFGLWALEVSGIAFAGFVGLSAPVPFELPLPGIVAEPREIGWRLARPVWGRGYATEAALLVLRHAFDALRLPQVVSFTTLGNLASQAVMQRIGPIRRGEFDHPRLPQGHRSRRHVLYAQDATARGTRPP